ncbi:MAG: hypothetical protein RI906_3012 [Pseudomonadota bacterium]|jgi:hypothetical protein
MTEEKHGKDFDLTAPKDVITQARAVMGGIDFDPYTTPYNNRLVLASRIIDLRLTDPELIATMPWEVGEKGRVFLSVPGGGTLCRRLANKALREYRAGRVKEAVIWLGVNESMTRMPWIWDFPVCVPFRRLRPRYWDEEAEQFRPIAPANWSFALYLPPSDNPHDFHTKLSRFHVAFSAIGRVVFDTHSGEGDWLKAYKALTKRPYDYHS